MSLEEEALRSSGADSVPRSTEPKPPRTFDRLLRFIATVLLLGILTVVYWVPMELMEGDLAAALVLAVLTMMGAGVASRLYHLRIRVQALEAVLDDRDRRTPSTEPPAAASAASSMPASEKVQHKP